MGEMRNAYKISGRKRKEKKPYGRHTHEWKGNIRMDLQRQGMTGLDASGSG
jgi:hypothetical protein